MGKRKEKLINKIEELVKACGGDSHPQEEQDALAKALEIADMGKRKWEKLHAGAFETRIIDFTTFLLAIPKEKITPIDGVKEQTITFKVAETSESNQISERSVFYANNFSEKDLKEQFIKQVSEINPIIIEKRNGKSFKNTFSLALEEACLRIINKFDWPEVCIKLDKKTYVVGNATNSCGADSVVLKYIINNFKGALVVNRKDKFQMFKIED